MVSKKRAVPFSSRFEKDGDATSRFFLRVVERDGDRASNAVWDRGSFHHWNVSAVVAFLDCHDKSGALFFAGRQTFEGILLFSGVHERHALGDGSLGIKRVGSLLIGRNLERRFAARSQEGDSGKE